MGIETLISVIIRLLVCGMLVWCVNRIPNMPPPILAAVEIIIVLVFALFILGNIGFGHRWISSAGDVEAVGKLRRSERLLMFAYGSRGLKQ